MHLCPEAGHKRLGESVRRERHDLRPVDVGRFDQCGAQRGSAGGGGKRQFYFLPGTYGDPSVTPATATTSNVIQAEVAPGTIVAGLGTRPCDVVINGALSINNGSLAIRDSQMSNLTINPIQANVPAGGMLWYTSQTATLRRVNILGDLYVSPVTQTPGAARTLATR